MVFYLNVFKDGKEKKMRTENKKRFQHWLRTVEFDTAILRVKYGMGINFFGKKLVLDNWGHYDNREDLIIVFKQFTEPELVEYLESARA